MDSGLPEFLDIEYRRLRRIVRVLLMIALAFPTFAYGPLIWKDGTYDARWVFAADIPTRPVECRGIPFFLLACEVKFAERSKNTILKLDYLVVGVDWCDLTTDIVRSTDNRLTAAIGVTGSGLLTRISALGFLFVLGLSIERMLLRIKFRSLQDRVFNLTASPRNKDAYMLSRDRRDHF